LDIVFDWRLRAEKPLLKSLSFLLKPLFRWNHGWAMARGEEGLRRELIRRRAVGWIRKRYLYVPYLDATAS
jgi:hypothetical protein